MPNDNTGLTPDQYMLQTLKRQIGERYASYEEALATVQTQLAMAENRIRELEGELDAQDVHKEAEEPGVEA